MTTLHTTHHGQHGKRVLLVHGLFGQGRNWTQIGKALAEQHRVSLVDLPDHGRSPWTERVDYLAMADALAALVEPGDPVALVGHSMGGKAAMAAALRHPDLVERLAVVDMAPVTYPGAGDFERYVAAMRGLDLATLGSRGEAEAQLSESVPDPGVRGFLLQNLRRGEQGWQWQQNLDLLGDELDTIRGWPEPALAEVAPYPGRTLVLSGAESDYVTAEHEEAFQRWFPRRRQVVVKGAGHWVHSAQPAVVLETLRRFLAS